MNSCAISKNQTAMVLRTALNILEKWSATAEQSCKILRISRSSITRVNQGRKVRLDIDQLCRASLILNCHAVLRRVFDNPENIYGFPTMKNHNDFFNGRTPLEIMAQGDFMPMLETYKRIEELDSTFSFSDYQYSGLPVHNTR